jgi:CRP-like cAMP-binding protein
MSAPEQPVSPEHLITMVSESALFHRFNPARLLDLRDTLEFVALEAGDVLFNEGDSIDSFFLLVHGELDERSSPDSRSHSITRPDFELNPTVGVKRLLTDEIRVSTVTAISPSGLVRISKDTFMNSEFMGFDQDALRRDIMKRLLEGELKKVLVPMFRLRDMGMFNDLSKQLEWIHNVRGGHVFDQQDETDGFYILMSGRLQVLVQRTDDGKSTQVNEITAHQVSRG